MRAFVLSGGGPLGPPQVGALRALLEHDIRPDMVVGCSVGALNAAYFVRDFSLENVEALANVWRGTTTQDIYPGRKPGTLWRLLSGKDSLFDNRRFYAYLQQHGLSPAETFASLAGQTRLYITATYLHSGQLRVFGDDPNDLVLDAVMASTALMPLLPPWEVNGERYIDGAATTPLPLRVALDRGATEIYSLRVAEAPGTSSGTRITRGLWNVLARSITTMFQGQMQHDLLLADMAKRVKMHKIELSVEDPPGPTDFSQADRLLELGYEQMQAYLAAQQPQRSRRSRAAFWRRSPDRAQPDGTSAETAPIPTDQQSKDSMP